MAESDVLTLTDAAFRIGGRITWRQLTRLARRGAIPVKTLGHIRVVRAADLDAIRAACIAAGYYRAEAQEAAGAAR
jgi:hypothetical protein